LGLALFDLLASSGINIDSLQSADEQELIRLEKRIKATQKLNDSYPQELVVQAIDVLRRRKNALLFVLSEQTIQALNRGEFKYLFNAQIEFPTGNDLDEVKALFRSALEDDLREHLVALMRNNEWTGLYNWLKLTPVFSQDLLTSLQRKLVDVVNDLIQSLAVSNWNGAQKTRFSFIGDIIFYQVMNRLDSSELLALIYQFFNASQSYYQQGVNLNEYSNFFDKMSLYRPDDTRFHQIRKSVSLSPILKEIQADADSGGVGSVLKTVGIIVFILISLARSCNRMDSNRGNSNSSYDKHDIQEWKRAQKHKNKRMMDFSTYQANLSSLKVFGNCDSVKTGGHKRYGEPQLSDLEAVTGFILKGNLNLKNLKFERRPVVFVNWTKQDLVVYMVLKTENPFESSNDPDLTTSLSAGAVVIKAGDSLMVGPKIIRFFLHSGKRLYSYSHTSSGQYQSLYNWAFCPISPLDSALIIRTFELYKDTKDSGGRIEITKNNKSYKLKWTGLSFALYDHFEEKYVSRNSTHIIDLKSTEKKKR